MGGGYSHVIKPGGGNLEFVVHSQHGEIERVRLKVRLKLHNSLAYTICSRLLLSGKIF